MQKIISSLIFVTVLVFISGCKTSSQTETEWTQRLDLCQLAAWRPDAYVDINAACTGVANADDVLRQRLQKRFECLKQDDFVSCISTLPATTPQTSDHESLDLSRKFALSQGEEQSALLTEISTPEPKETAWTGSWLGEWKKQLHDDGLLKGKYTHGILPKRWRTSEIDWLAFHAYSSEMAREPEQQLMSRVTLAVELAHLGLYEEAALNLDKLSTVQMKRVLKPDLSLYHSTAPDFSSQDPQDNEQGAARAFSKTVAAIVAIRLQTNDKRAAEKTLSQAKPALSTLTGGGDKYIELLEFVLGKDLPNEEIFEKMFLDLVDYPGPYGTDGFAGLSGWEHLANGTALALVLKKRLEETQTELSGFELKTARVEWNVPNMSDTDFLAQPEGLRAKMAYYKPLVKDKIDPVKSFGPGLGEAPKLEAPDYAAFKPQDNTAPPIDERVFARIKKAGIGTKRMAAVREIGPDRLQIIYLSRAIESGGRMKIPGYWLLDGNPESGEWKDPAYMGLRGSAPYRIDGFAPAGASPGQEKTLQLIGTAQYIDYWSNATLPKDRPDPVRGVISVDLAAVYRDSDGDSLSDLFETRIGLKPDNPDTDGDGIPDKRDSVPTRKHDGPREDLWKAYALLSILENRDAGQVRISPPASGEEKPELFFGMSLKSNSDARGAIHAQRSTYAQVYGQKAEDYDPIPPVYHLRSAYAGFGSVDLPFMVVVQTEAEARALSKPSAPHDPPVISRQLDDPYSDRTIVIWQAGWGGGTILFTGQPDGGYTRKVLQTWVS